MLLSTYRSTFTLIYLLSILMLLSSCSGENQAKESAQADGSKTNALPSVEEITEVQTDLTKDAKQSLNDAKNSIAEASEEIENKLDKAGKKISDSAVNFGKQIEKSADKVAKKTNSVKDKIVENATDIKDNIISAKEVSKKNNNTVNSNPEIPTPSTVNKTSDVDKPTSSKDAVSSNKTVSDGMSHEVFDQLLRKYVSANGVVDYQGIKTDINKFDGYLEELRRNPVNNKWSKDKQLAYWINAYNAFTIKMIINNYPVSKITDLEGGKPWDKSWIKLGNKTYSLNNIENDIIRPQFEEPRIHFAVNCAAKSCPPLLNRAWTEENLEKFLATQTKNFITNVNYNQIKSTKATISKIFDWYKEDFSDLIAFLNKYSDTKLKQNSEISFMEYNWSLNGK